MPESRKAEILKQTRLFKDFFKIDEIIVAYQLRDGTMSKPQRRLVFERGDAVAVMLHNLDRNSAILVDQFKVASLIGRRRDDPATSNGWITETPAGMVEANEKPAQTAIRETEEETGYRIRDPELITVFFSSPGGTSERIFLYFAEVRDADKVGPGGGVAKEGEDITVLDVPVDELFDRLAKGTIDDPKLAIGAYWLKARLNGAADVKTAAGAKRVSGASPGATTPSAAFGPLGPPMVRYGIVGKPGLFVGYRTGPIDDVKGVSIWVNSENTDMMMDRFIGKSISARIRYLGANKEDDNVIEDTIQEALRGVIGERAHVKIGTVLVTESGMLCSTNQVQRIFHVATVEGAAGEGVKANATKIKLCVENVLRRVDQENHRLWRLILNKNLDSILFPMLGAGDGGLSLDSVAADLIPVAIKYFLNNSNPTLKEIYFLAFREPHKAACDRVLNEYCADGVLSLDNTIASG